MPMATKTPTQRSSVERPTFTCGLLASRSLDPPEHEDGEDEIEREDRERALDDGARRRARHALGRRLRVETFEYRDHADGGAEDDALDDAVQDVVPEIDGGFHVPPERAGIDVDQPHAD